MFSFKLIKYFFFRKSWKTSKPRRSFGRRQPRARTFRRKPTVQNLRKRFCRGKICRTVKRIRHHLGQSVVLRQTPLAHLRRKVLVRFDWKLFYLIRLNLTTFDLIKFNNSWVYWIRYNFWVDLIWFRFIVCLL